MSETRFIPRTDTEAEKSPYELVTSRKYLKFRKVEITERDESKLGKPATKVRVTKENGEAVEIAAVTPFFVFKSRSGKELVVPALTAGHIDELHIKGTEDGSLFTEPSLEALMRDIAPRIPESIVEEPGISELSVDMGKGMGQEDIASMRELVSDGVLTEEDVTQATALKEEVMGLNKAGTKEAKEAFIAGHADGKVRFQLIRGDVLVPVVDAPKRPTTKLFMVFGPVEGDDRKMMYTAAPGRNMPRHPNPNQHKNAEGVLDEQTFKESADAWFNTVMLDQSKLEATEAEKPSERWTRLGHENLESIPMPEALKNLVRASLETPQLSPYHNEGPEMAAHLGLIMETVEAIHSDKFDFRALELPPDLEDKVKERITKAIQTNYAQMRTYAYLHDLEKPSCMNIEDANGKQRVFTMEEWRELVAQNGGDKEKAMVALTSQGYTKIGYRIGGELANELGVENKDHGDEGERIIRDLATKDEDTKRFVDGLGLILKGIANHELHFQVFNNAKSAGMFEKFLASNFSEDEIDFIYTACLIDLAGSLNERGKPNFGGFRNMVVARESHDLIVGSGLEDTNELVTLDSTEKVIAKIERLKMERAVKESKISEADVEAIIGQAVAWGITNEEGIGQLRKALTEAIEQKDPLQIINKALPKALKRYTGQIKGYLEKRVTS